MSDTIQSSTTNKTKMEPIVEENEFGMKKEAFELFQMCDHGKKGFVTIGDLTQLKLDLGLTSEQMEAVFTQLDKDGDGLLTPEEFEVGLELFLGPHKSEESDKVDDDGSSVPTATAMDCHSKRQEFRKVHSSTRSSFSNSADLENILPSNLEVSELLQDQGAIQLWYQMQNEHPDMLPTFEEFLKSLASEHRRVQDEITTLHQSFNKKTNAYEKQICVLYEEMETQIQGEREKIHSKKLELEKQLRTELEDAVQTKDEDIQELLNRWLKATEQLEIATEGKAATEHANNRLLQEKEQLEQQLEEYQTQLNVLRSQMSTSKESDLPEKRERFRCALKLSERIAWEREALLKQLDLLRSINRRLQDERDEVASGRLYQMESTDDLFSLTTDAENGTTNSSLTSTGPRRGSILSDYFGTQPRSLCTSDSTDQEDQVNDNNNNNNEKQTEGDFSDATVSVNDPLSILDTIPAFASSFSSDAMSDSITNSVSDSTPTLDSVPCSVPVLVVTSDSAPNSVDCSTLDSVTDSVANSVFNSNTDTVDCSTLDSVFNSNTDTVDCSTLDSVGNSVSNSNTDTAPCSFTDSVYFSVTNSVSYSNTDTAPCSITDSFTVSEAATPEIIFPPTNPFAPENMTPSDFISDIDPFFGNVKKNDFESISYVNFSDPDIALEATTYFTDLVDKRTPTLCLVHPNNHQSNQDDTYRIFCPDLETMCRSKVPADDTKVGSRVLANGEIGGQTNADWAGAPEQTSPAVAKEDSSATGLLVEKSVELMTNTVPDTLNVPQTVFKVIFIGDSGVGKTSLINRICGGQFSDNFSTTIGVDFRVRTVHINNQQVVMQLWDTAGQERFRSLTGQYMRRSDGVLIVYDVNSEASFSNVTSWMSTIEASNEDLFITLVGNKADKSAAGRRKAVPTQHGQRLAENQNSLFFETSAKDGIGIEELIMSVARRLQTKQVEEMENSVRLSSSFGSPPIASKKVCC